MLLQFFSFFSKIYYTGIDGVVVVYNYLNEKEKGRKCHKYNYLRNVILKAESACVIL